MATVTTLGLPNQYTGVIEIQDIWGFRLEVLEPGTSHLYRLGEDTPAYTGSSEGRVAWMLAQPIPCDRCHILPRTSGDFGSFLTCCPNCEDYDGDGEGYWPVGGPQGTGNTEAEAIADWNEQSLEALEAYWLKEGSPCRMHGETPDGEEINGIWSIYCDDCPRNQGHAEGIAKTYEEAIARWNESNDWVPRGIEVAS